MLRHTPSEAEQSVTERIPSSEAARMRVTPEELIQAMAAIEARREQEARERDGTIAIGDAVQELGLNATPEEILAAIQAQRRQQQVQQQVQPLRRARPMWPLKAAMVVMALFVSLFVLRSLTIVAVAPPAVATLAPEPEATLYPPTPPVPTEVFPSPPPSPAPMTLPPPR